MTLKQITKALKKSDRWGCNDQPDLETMQNMIASLDPLIVRMVRDDTLTMVLSLPTTELALSAATCLASWSDSLDYELVVGDQWSFTLWWD